MAIKSIRNQFKPNDMKANVKPLLSKQNMKGQSINFKELRQSDFRRSSHPTQRLEKSGINIFYGDSYS